MNSIRIKNQRKFEKDVFNTAHKRQIFAVYISISEKAWLTIIIMKSLNPIKIMKQYGIKRLIIYFILK